MKFNKIKIENALYKYFCKRKLKNLSVGIAYKEDQFFFNYGFEDFEFKGEDAVYEIGSVTKLFVAAVYASLVSKDQINLEDTLQHLLGQHFEISPQFRDITIQSLLNHTSGLPRLPEEFLSLIEDINNPYRDFDDSIIAEYLKLSDDAIKERKYEYSNLGYGILGYILTIKFKKELYPIIKEVILDPLEMNITTILPFAEPGLLLPGHNSSNSIVPHWEMNSFQGAGCLLSSSTDMVKFLNANLDHNNSLYPFLKLTQQFENKKRAALGWHMYGLLGRFLRFHKYIWHNGMTGGFASYIAINPSAKIGAVAFTNKTDELDECMFGLYVDLGLT